MSIIFYYRVERYGLAESRNCLKFWAFFTLALVGLVVHEYYIVSSSLSLTMLYGVCASKTNTYLNVKLLLPVIPLPKEDRVVQLITW